MRMVPDEVACRTMVGLICNSLYGDATLQDLPSDMAIYGAVVTGIWNADLLMRF